jgi:hypothetical protein
MQRSRDGKGVERGAGRLAQQPRAAPVVASRHPARVLIRGLQQRAHQAVGCALHTDNPILLREIRRAPPTVFGVPRETEVVVRNSPTPQFIPRLPAPRPDSLILGFRPLFAERMLLRECEILLFGTASTMGGRSSRRDRRPASAPSGAASHGSAGLARGKRAGRRVDMRASSDGAAGARTADMAAR